MPELDGAYVFGDYSRNRVEPDGTLFMAERAESGLWPLREIRPFLADEDIDGTLNRFVLGFGQDNDGEMYLLAKTSGGPEGETGQVFRLVAPDESGVADEAEEEEEGGGSSIWLWILIGAVVLIGLAVLFRKREAKSPGGESS